MRWSPDSYPHAAPVSQTATRAVCVYSFGADRVQVRLQLDDAQCRIGFRVLNRTRGARYEAGIILVLKPAETVAFGNTAAPVLPTAMIHRDFEQDAAEFVWRGRRFRVPAGAVLDYPLIPHNPYTQHGLPAQAEYVARLSMPLQEQEQQVLVS